MEIINERVKIFLDGSGNAIIGQEDGSGGADGYKYIKLKYPFRLYRGAEGSDSVKVAAVWAKDEWIKLPIQNSIEVSVSKGYLDLYEKYVNHIHSGIIIPESSQIII